MKIWKLVSADNSFVIKLKNFKEDKSKLTFEGDVIMEWEPVEFVTTYNKRNNNDFPSYLNGIPVMTVRAKELLETYISTKVQFFPIIHEKQLYVVNVTNVMDCLDYERSKYNVLSNGNIGYIEQVYFREDKIAPDEWIFKIKEQAATTVYVTDQFREVVLASKLKGFEFIEVWDSEFTIEKERELQFRYEDAINKINSQLDPQLDWSAAMELVNHGGAVASDRWKIQTNKDGEVLLGSLTMELTYLWVNPIYYPPILLGMKWCEAERSDI